MTDHEGTLQNDYDDYSMKTKLILECFGRVFGTLMSDEKSFFNIYWDFYRIGFISLKMQCMLIPQVYTLMIKF